jgi:hypothetical protein
MDLDELADHLSRASRLDRVEARRVVREVAAWLLEETVEAFVQRRHRELKDAGERNNDAIFRRIADEIVTRPFAAPPLSERQIRRLVYG